MLPHVHPRWWFSVNFARSSPFGPHGGDGALGLSWRPPGALRPAESPRAGGRGGASLADAVAGPLLSGFCAPFSRDLVSGTDVRLRLHLIKMPPVYCVVRGGSGC